MADRKPQAPGEPNSPPAQPAGLEVPLHPSADPTKKTIQTSDPTADDPGNGAD